jgi:hypothetical protein
MSRTCGGKTAFRNPKTHAGGAVKNAEVQNFGGCA